MANTQDAPLCVSEYEAGDTECDGVPEASTPEEKASCGWRNRCVGLQCYLEETNKKIGDLVRFKVKKIPVTYTDVTTGESRTAEEECECAVPKGSRIKFSELCDLQVQRYVIRNGKVTRDPIGDPLPKSIKKKKKKRVDRRKYRNFSRRARKAAKVARHRKHIKRLTVLAKLFRHLMYSLELELRGTKYKFAKPRQPIAPGRLYFKDNIYTSSRASVYCKDPFVRDPVVLLAHFKTQDLVFDIQMPVDVNLFSESARKRLNIKPMDRGQFKSIAMNLGKDGVLLAAETIAMMIKSGKIDLPEAAT